MPSHPRPLPPALGSAFHVTAADEFGVSRARLRRLDLTTPFHGVRTGVDAAPRSLLDRCRAYAPRLAPWQFYSHETALALLDIPTPEWPYEPGLHVSAHRPAREPRTVGVVGHRLQARTPATRSSPHGLPTEHPARAWRQCGTLWALDDLVAAADALLSGRSPLVTADELDAEIATMGDVRRGILRRALSSARTGVRSPRETRLRLALVRAGLPEPDAAWNLYDTRGTFVAELDLAYPRWMVAPEYDGRVHAEDERQFARDADRWTAIREQGWDHVRILNHHMRDGAAPAVTLVRNALLRAGWRPL
jgi:hypothetical protein